MREKKDQSFTVHAHVRHRTPFRPLAAQIRRKDLRIDEVYASEAEAKKANKGYLAKDAPTRNVNNSVRAIPLSKTKMETKIA